MADAGLPASRLDVRRWIGDILHLLIGPDRRDTLATIHMSLSEPSVACSTYEGKSDGEIRAAFTMSVDVPSCGSTSAA